MSLWCLPCPLPPRLNSHFPTHPTPLPHCQITSHKDVIGTISTEATQEGGLEAMLGKINDKWRHTEFTVLPYKVSVRRGRWEALARLHHADQSVGKPPSHHSHTVVHTLSSSQETKDAFILGEVDEVLAVLEESMSMVGTIMSSRFVAGIR